MYANETTRLLRRKVTCAVMLVPGVGGPEAEERHVAEVGQIFHRVLLPAQFVVGAHLPHDLASQVDDETGREEVDAGPVLALLARGRPCTGGDVLASAVRLGYESVDRLGGDELAELRIGAELALLRPVPLLPGEDGRSHNGYQQDRAYEAAT
ncbi:hypothetical protein J7E99_39640 [Streptomyces sp. ISL-44]|nr:hypothetical protein [Streptomyces sp. ISL-44]